MLMPAISISFVIVVTYHQARAQYHVSLEFSSPSYQRIFLQVSLAFLPLGPCLVVVSVGVRGEGGGGGGGGWRGCFRKPYSHILDTWLLVVPKMLMS